ncbi:MAG: aldose epimerase family protein [Longibaculum sp.]
MIEVIQKIDDHIDLISMKNDQLEVVVSNFGCTIIKVFMKDKNGHVDDVVLGYDDFQQYQTLDAYLGALVGRIANRIGKGEFSLNGEDYHLAINNGPNHLHGGIKGFSYQVFDYEIKDENTIEFHYLSKDGEEGYPGNLDFKAIYQLLGDTLTIRYLATTDKDTIINITNHSYFNLSGKQENIYHHLLTVKADRFACIDGDGLPTGQIREVKGSPFDFLQPALIGERIEEDDEQLKLGKGFDHPFLFNEKENQVILEHQESGRRLIVSTTLPGAQIYTANYLDGRLGKYGQHYFERDALCIETQNLPDAIHIEKNPTTILKKGEIYDETTSYRFEVIK